MATKYKVRTKAFFGGVLYGPGTKRPVLTCDKPIKGTLPAHLELIKSVATKRDTKAPVAPADDVSFIEPAKPKTVTTV